MHVELTLPLSLALAMGLMQTFLLPTLAFAQSTTSMIVQPSHVSSTSTTSLPSPAAPSSFARKLTTWDLGFGGEYQGEGKDETLAIKTQLGLEMEFRFTNQLRIRLSPGASFYSARSQSNFDSDNFQDRITLREGYLEFAPIEQIKLSIGSHSQRFINQTQLVSRYRSFPGILLSTNYRFDESGLVFLNAEEAVPTSYTYNALREDKEQLPGLSIINAGVDYDLTSKLRARLEGGSLMWRNLPSKVALNSQRLGNTPEGELAPSYRFRTGFETSYVLARALICQGCVWGFEAQYSRSRNNLAPTESADAQLVGGGIRYTSDESIFRLEYFQFFAESDVTPASYSQSSLGGTNRQGQKLQLEVEIPKMELSLKAGWIQATPITPSPYQNDLNSISLGVETHGNFL